MIVKMSKYAFMVYHKEYDEFLERLRGMGVVHIQEKRSEKEDDGLQQLLAERKRLQNELRYLKRVQEDGLKELKDEAKSTKSKLKPELEISPERPVTVEEGRTLLNRIEDLRNRIEKAQAAEQAVEKDMAAMAVWGEFDYVNLDRLRDAGYEVTFFSCPASRYDEDWGEAYNAVPISVLQSVAYFVTITPVGTVSEIDAERVKMPEKGLKDLQADLLSQRQEKAELNEEMLQIATNDYKTLKAYDRLLSNEYAWGNAKVQTNREADDRLMLLEGWIPAAQEQSLEAELDRNNYYFRKLDITPEDNIPIDLENNWFSRLFEPISRLYMLPKYSELDLTPFFAPFFMIFFGLCLGDSGYGLFLLVVATAVKMIKGKTLKPSVKGILSLVQLLGMATFLCGLLTGTFFGANLYDWGIPLFDTLKEKIYFDNNKMFSLSLILGVIQIIFGMCLKAVNKAKQFGVVYSLSTIGWIILLVSMGVAFLCPQVMPMFGTIHLIVMGLSGFLIFFVNSPGKNLLLNMGLGLWDTYNMATGLLGDVLSYVRLFALGLSGGILAGVFNSLAVGMSPDHVVFGPVVMVLIFVIGHAINIFMNVLGALVHPMRLTFVEFFKNSGYEGGGLEYKPFKKW
ncbi:V-type ATP synthase subunit I [Tannerella forsythia]|uniref:V-type ATP synthase subunit I n=1 Tax=Tannerella forsythia TaxID=28112 RepID=UPI002430D80F|nr:V-type ATPase 116kDa subunit family protein [Tannerella forsythia]